MGPLRVVDNCIIFWLLLCLMAATADSDNETSGQKIVKKVLKNSPPPVGDVPVEAAQPEVHSGGLDGGIPQVIVLSERPPMDRTSSKNETIGAKSPSINKSEQQQKEVWNNVVEESKYKVKDTQPEDDEIPESFKTGFYLFVGLSTSALLFIVFKLYRMRLSRAERKYGVQGDRTTQELTPLPVSIEDVNSDDEDQTLFEINRQQIRLL